jgi:hypothetical protein
VSAETAVAGAVKGVVWQAARRPATDSVLKRRARRNKRIEEAVLGKNICARVLLIMRLSFENYRAEADNSFRRRWKRLVRRGPAITNKEQ